MSWYANGYASQYCTVENDSRIRYENKDHAFGIWFRRGGNSNNSTSGVIVNQELVSGSRFRLYAGDSDHPTEANKLVLEIRDSVTTVKLTWDGPIVNGQWYHVIMQRVGNTEYLYIDGVEITSADVSGLDFSADGNVMYFTRHSAGSGYTGYVAEFFKFGRALTAGEITSLAGGSRINQVQAAGTYLESFIPMDSDVFRDYHNQLTITRVSMQVYDNVHPPIYDQLPEVTTYFASSTHKKVQFTGSSYLDVTKETPYGILTPTTTNSDSAIAAADDISYAVNWALRYMRETDPSLRVPAGGPEGAFTPYIPSCDANEYWISKKPWFIRNLYGSYLQGQRNSQFAYDISDANSFGGSHVGFYLGNKSIPCIINQAAGGRLENLSISSGRAPSGSKGPEKFGMVNHSMTVDDDGTLTTRTSDTAGIVTFGSSVSGEGPNTGETVQLWWSGGCRFDVQITAIQSIGASTRRIFTFSGGRGDSLPPQGTTIEMRDWCHYPDNYGGYARSAQVTNRTSNNVGHITLSSGSTFFELNDRVSIIWNSGASNYQRDLMQVIEATGNIIRISGGTGTVMPITGSTVTAAEFAYDTGNPVLYGTSDFGSQPVTHCVGNHTDWNGFAYAAIQNGGYENVSNCDHMTFYETTFNECERGWLNINGQGVNIKFETVNHRGTNIVFDFQAGGFFKADHVLSAYANTKLLNIGLGDSLNTGPGKLNGYFKLTDVKTDTEATTGAWIVYMEGDSGNDLNRWLTIIIDGGQNSRAAGSGTQESRDKFCRIVGRCRFIIRDLSFPGVIECIGGDPGSSYAGSQFAPLIVFDNVEFLSSAQLEHPELTIVSGVHNGIFINGGSCVNGGSTSVFDRPYFLNPQIPGSGLGSFWRPSGTGTVAGLSYNAGDLIYSSNINNTRKHIILAPYTGMSAES